MHYKYIKQIYFRCHSSLTKLPKNLLTTKAAAMYLMSLCLAHFIKGYGARLSTFLTLTRTEFTLRISVRHVLTYTADVHDGCISADAVDRLMCMYGGCTLAEGWLTLRAACACRRVVIRFRFNFEGCKYFTWIICIPIPKVNWSVTACTSW